MGRKSGSIHQVVKSHNCRKDLKTLIFDPILSGHHLEYLHHLYVGASEKSDCDYIFAVPERQWAEIKNKFYWKSAKNVEWFMLDDDECAVVHQGSLSKQCWKLSCLIKRTLLKTNADSVFLVTLASAIPVLPFIIPKDVTIAGIIYKIYLRSKQSFLRKFIDRVRYAIMARSHKIKNVFILNDLNSAMRLNKIYSTEKFIPLPDPVPDVSVNNLKDLRQELGISSEKKVFLHFGAMNHRKGTIEILKALCGMSQTTHSDKVFIFAGRVDDGIKQHFYDKVDFARSRGANIIVKDEFCEYEYLNNLCYTADSILIPYLLTDLSSGVIGYAAVHRTPVIGPASGLIGDLIRDNNLGVVLDKITAESLADAITEFNPVAISSDYAARNRLDAFYSTILN